MNNFVIRSYNRKSLLKHNVLIDEIKEVLRSPLTITIDLEPSKRGNCRVMWIGFTFNLRLLEIGLEYLENDNEYVFHAMDAARQYRKEFGKKLRT